MLSIWGFGTLGVRFRGSGSRDFRVEGFRALGAGAWCEGFRGVAILWQVLGFQV